MGKRLNGEGTIYYNESRNRWEGQISYVLNGKRKRKKVIGKSRKEVKEKAKEAKALLEEQVEELTLGKWLEQWLKVFVVGHVKLKTEERYKTAVKKHIIPNIGDINVKILTSLQIQEFINSLHENGGVKGIGLSPRTVNSARTVLSTALKQAVGAGIIDKNPVLFTKPIKTNRREISVLNKDECRKLVEAAKAESNQAFWIAVVIALETGLRKGEIFGLRWRDINFNKQQLTVNTTVVTSNHGIVIQDSTKTKYSRRTVKLTESTIRKLKEYKEWQLAYLNAIGAKDIYDGFLITSERGSVKDPNNFSYVTFKSLLKKAGLRDNIRFHDLRHTHATQLLQAGVDIKSVSERLGHSSIRITLDTYTHVLPSMNDNVIQKLSALKLSGD